MARMSSRDPRYLDEYASYRAGVHSLRQLRFGVLPGWGGGGCENDDVIRLRMYLQLEIRKRRRDDE